ncbi:hypothetical protein BDW62DRAFT_196348 [Aspergillus aurantiobrunneus]
MLSSNHYQIDQHCLNLVIDGYKSHPYPSFAKHFPFNSTGGPIFNPDTIKEFGGCQQAEYNQMLCWPTIKELQGIRNPATVIIHFRFFKFISEVFDSFCSEFHFVVHDFFGYWHIFSCHSQSGVDLLSTVNYRSGEPSYKRFVVGEPQTCRM